MMNRSRNGKCGMSPMEMADRNGQPKGVRRNHRLRRRPGPLLPRPPIPILKPHDIALVEATAGLRLDDFERDEAGGCDPTAVLVSREADSAGVVEDRRLGNTQPWTSPTLVPGNHAHHATGFSCIIDPLDQNSVTRQQKLLQRLQQMSGDLTWDEAVKIMRHHGFALHAGAGSSRRFGHARTGVKVLVHEPHPGNIVKRYAQEDLLEGLRAAGEIE